MLGAVIPVRPGQWKYLKEISQAIEEAGWEYAFSAEGPYAEDNDSMAAAMFMATTTQRVQVGTSIAISYLRHPYMTASTSRILQELTGGRFVLGLGPSHPAINEALGIEMTRPVAEMRQYVAKVKNYLGDKPHPPIWLAALRPAMSRLAGEVADGVNFHHIPISMLGQVIDSVREGERRAVSGQKCGIAAYARIVLTDDLSLARRVGRATLRQYCNLPAYQQLYEGTGYADEMAALRNALAQGDEEAANRAITDRLLDDVQVLGPAIRCRDQLEKFRAAGVDVLLFPPLAVADQDLPSLFGPLLREFSVTNPLQGGP